MLAEARELVIDQSQRNEWQNVAGALMLAAEMGKLADLAEAERRLRNALSSVG